MNSTNNIKSYNFTRILLIFNIFCVLTTTCCETKENNDNFFSYIQPENVGVAADSLKVIVNKINTWVDAQDIVGAELLIIKKKRIILHHTFGWMNLEKKVPMKKNTIFNIRSMTKPFVGTAILMLYEQGKLSLNDRVSKYIHSFDNEKGRDITIDHLLMHTSGLTSSQENGSKHNNLEAVVEESSKSGPIFEPGSRLYYSGRNSAILTFIIKTVTGITAEMWIKNNILDPLDMNETFCVHHHIPPDTLLRRISHVYILKNGHYVKYRDPSWIPEFPFFGGGVGLYSTARDYAKFLAMWMNWGNSKRKFFQDSSTVTLAFQSNPFDPTYARHWNIFKPAAENENKLPAFGHIGDFGTMAFAVPESDLIICFFTQSRYNKILGNFLTLVERTIY